MHAATLVVQWTQANALLILAPCTMLACLLKFLEPEACWLNLCGGQPDAIKFAQFELHAALFSFERANEQRHRVN